MGHGTAPEHLQPKLHSLHLLRLGHNKRIEKIIPCGNRLQDRQCCQYSLGKRQVNTLTECLTPHPSILAASSRDVGNVE